MARYLEFKTADGGTVLVEVEPKEVEPAPQGGLVKAGVKEKIKEAVADAVVQARATLEEAIGGTIRSNARAFLLALEGMSERPTEAELTFGVKATGELGNAAVGKAGGEASYTVKLVWKRSPEPGRPQ